MRANPFESTSNGFSLSPNDFQEAFGEELSPYVKSKVQEYAFAYEALTPTEKDQCTKRFIDALLHGNLIRAGEERHDQWEKGWGENLSSLRNSKQIESIIPRYFEKYNIVRWKQEWVKPASPQFEYRMLAIIQDWLFDKYLRDVSEIYEFGCGTGHNLFRARAVNPKAKLWGLDWAESSQGIINKVREDGVDSNIYGHRFDYFHPDYEFNIAKNSAVVTVASLEQVGTKFEAFVEFLLKKKPKLCIHIEPIAELLDSNHLLDYLSIEYFKKRNYLSGFLSKLRELESQNKIEILKAQRTFIGSFFIEGYSVIVWEPR